MSRENVELAHRIRGRVQPTRLGCLSRTAGRRRGVRRGRVVEGDYRGRAGIRRWWENVLAVIPDLTVEVVEMRDLGDLTLGAGRVRGHGAGSDTPFDETS
jgi:hypothetical protein